MLGGDNDIRLDQSFFNNFLVIQLQLVSFACGSALVVTACHRPPRLDSNRIVDYSQSIYSRLVRVGVVILETTIAARDQRWCYRGDTIWLSRAVTMEDTVVLNVVDDVMMVVVRERPNH